MSTEQARDLVRRVTSDAEFRDRLDQAPYDRKRAILSEEGYGDVRLRHVSEALPESAGGALTDEEFAAVAGAGVTTVVTVGGGAAGSAVVSATVISVAAAVV